MEKKRYRDKALLIHLEVNQHIEIVLRAVASVSRGGILMMGKVFFIHHEMIGLVVAMVVFLLILQIRCTNCMLFNPMLQTPF